MRPAPLLPLLLLMAVGCAGHVHPGSGGETLIFLVRHAERAEDGTEDPHLSVEGQARSRILAELLKDAGLTHLHSTDLHRTRETVRPLATGTGLSVETYLGSDLEALAARLLATPGRHLVVGHSNTTPELVRALGGEPGPAIETMEYDRLYLVAVGPRGVRTVLLRFGRPFEG